MVGDGVQQALGAGAGGRQQAQQARVLHLVHGGEYYAVHTTTDHTHALCGGSQIYRSVLVMGGRALCVVSTVGYLITIYDIRAPSHGT